MWTQGARESRRRRSRRKGNEDNRKKTPEGKLTMNTLLWLWPEGEKSFEGYCCAHEESKHKFEAHHFKYLFLSSDLQQWTVLDVTGILLLTLQYIRGVNPGGLGGRDHPPVLCMFVLFRLCLFYAKSKLWILVAGGYVVCWRSASDGQWEIISWCHLRPGTSLLNTFIKVEEEEQSL